MNIQTIILLVALIVLITLATVYVIRHKSISKCAFCNGDCTKCHTKCSNK